jgi:two-component system, LytTR family, response regulator
MEPLTAILVDDELSSLENLHQKLREFIASIKVVGMTQRPEDALSLIRTHRPDIVFLDIEMPRISGFKILEDLRDMDFKVIFVTAYNQYAIDAIRISAFDYLVKPVIIKELRTTVDRLVHASMDKYRERLDILRRNLWDERSQDQRIAIPSADSIELTPIRDIIRIESNSNYSRIVLADGKSLVVPKLLKDFESMLRTYGFYRIHNSHLINLAYVTKYIRGDGGQVMMQNGDLVDVSRRKKDEFISLINFTG